MTTVCSRETIKILELCNKCRFPNYLDVGNCLFTLNGYGGTIDYYLVSLHYQSSLVLRNRSSTEYSRLKKSKFS